MFFVATPSGQLVTVADADADVVGVVDSTCCGAGSVKKNRVIYTLFAAIINRFATTLFNFGRDCLARFYNGTALSVFPHFIRIAPTALDSLPSIT